MGKNTKVILTDSVANLGHSGDVVEVKAGYARNYLYPKGLAFAWNKSAASQIEQMQRRRRAQALATREDAVATKTALEGAVVEISAKVSESGKLFGGITPEAVSEALSAKGINVAAKTITVAGIKTTGDFPASANLHPEITAQFTVRVIAE